MSEQKLAPWRIIINKHTGFYDVQKLNAGGYLTVNPAFADIRNAEDWIRREMAGDEVIKEFWFPPEKE